MNCLLMYFGSKFKINKSHISGLSEFIKHIANNNVLKYEIIIEVACTMNFLDDLKNLDCNLYDGLFRKLLTHLVEDCLEFHTILFHDIIWVRFVRFILDKLTLLNNLWDVVIWVYEFIHNFLYLDVFKSIHLILQGSPIRGHFHQILLTFVRLVVAFKYLGSSIKWLTNDKLVVQNLPLELTRKYLWMTWFLCGIEGHISWCIGEQVRS